jgi:hypothetical protein
MVWLALIGALFLTLLGLGIVVWVVDDFLSFFDGPQ